MTSRRNEILAATAEAARVLSKFPLRSRTSFDIIGATRQLDIPFIFRPLKGLWGATLTVGGIPKGVLITTKLDLHVQRFTLAHELGHFLMGHKTSFDETIGFTGRYGPTSRPPEEIAADTFASELLAARSLIAAAAKRNQWTRGALGNPETIYQLSLRLGVSYQATCWALAGYRLISRAHAATIQGSPVKTLKTRLVPAALLTNPWSNVWKLTEADSGSYLEASSEDIFVFHLQENASAGYLWDLVDTGSDTRVLSQDTPEIGDELGANTTRIVLFQFLTPGTHQVQLVHRRPWNRETITQVEICVDNYGKEQAGFARQLRMANMGVETA